jgi:hypothetical protein
MKIKIILLTFLNKNNEYKTDSLEYITFDCFLKEFDTIPNEIGFFILNELISPIPYESSRCKQTWDWNLESLESISARKTNNRLDPFNKFSPETYFFYN